ncbi:hypothetical protein KJ840_00360 [Patescibacteria group bacterium]|nr:hypothetical protein [Patescibacteria group bacterium]
MLQSKLFGKTLREAPRGEVSNNAILLSRAGYIDKLMAGAYSYLPLGYKVLAKIQQIVREEMEAIGGQEIYMPALQPKELWQETGRWEVLKEIMFQFKGRGDKEFGLATTHEEVIVDIVRKRLTSYRDLPLHLFQIQDKFRNEPRAKSGLLRGREFSMKDLYSFHASQKDLEDYYQKAIPAYQKIFKRCGLQSIVTEASGGVFTKEFSHEFQAPTPYGEDEIITCELCDFSQNTEICKLKEGDKCPKCGGKVKLTKSIEVGNIFKLGCKYSADMGLTYADESGKKQEVIMGCYGIGPSRVMGSVVEVHHDDKGIVWPKNLTPYHVHLLQISDKRKKDAEKIYQDLIKQNIAVLYDDREESAGVKLNDADLIGINLQLIVGDKTKDKIEYRTRSGKDRGIIKMDEVVKAVEKIYH